MQETQLDGALRVVSLRGLHFQSERVCTANQGSVRYIKVVFCKVFYRHSPTSMSERHATKVYT